MSRLVVMKSINKDLRAIEHETDRKKIEETLAKIAQQIIQNEALLAPRLYFIDILSSLNVNSWESIKVGLIKDCSFFERELQCEDFTNTLKELRGQLVSLESRNYTTDSKEGKVIDDVDKVYYNLNVLLKNYVQSNLISFPILEFHPQYRDLANSNEDKFEVFKKAVGIVFDETQILENEDMKAHRGNGCFSMLQELLRRLFNFCQTKTEKILTNLSDHGVFQVKAPSAIDPSIIEEDGVNETKSPK